MTPPNVVLIVMDSVSAGRVSCYGYDRETTPNIDAFAEIATQYDNARANSSWTVPVHGTLFTGVHTSEHGAHARHKRFSVPIKRTLAGQLSSAGYRTVGLSTNPWISTDFDYDTGFDDFFDVHPPLPFDTERPQDLYQRLHDRDDLGWRKYALAAKWAFEGNPVTRTLNTIYDRQQNDKHATADVLNNRLFEWLDKTAERPFFMFLNYMDAHEPYNPSQEYLSKFRNEGCSVDISWHLRSLGEEYSAMERECINDKYDASLNFLDHHIAELLDGLRERQLLEDTLVVLTADHGKCLGEHNYMGVGTFLYDELLKVPLIVSHAGGSADELPTGTVSHIDINKMIRRTAGLNVDRGRRDGVLSETMGPHQDVDTGSHYVPQEGLRRVDYEDHSATTDLYTGEKSYSENCPTELRETFERIESTFLDNRIPIHNEETAVEMSDAVKKHLEELGYR